MPQQLNIESTMRAIQPQGSFYTCLLQEMGAAKKNGGGGERGKNKEEVKFPLVSPKRWVRHLLPWTWLWCPGSWITSIQRERERERENVDYWKTNRKIKNDLHYPEYCSRLLIKDPEQPSDSSQFKIAIAKSPSPPSFNMKSHVLTPSAMHEESSIDVIRDPGDLS